VCILPWLQVVWTQLMHEPLSRVDACITPGRDTQLSSRWVLPGSLSDGLSVRCGDDHLRYVPPPAVRSSL
jgi:hypothetical protein